MAGAVSTGNYRNVFAEYGIPQEEIDKRVEETFQTMFHGSEEERVFHEVGDDMGYMEDTGNHDARTEGMSYGMMMCVQLNKKEEFDRLWKWAKTYMYMEEGWNSGYFAWSCATDGTKNAFGPAPDGEEFFAMALFFASKRWGDGEGIFNYSAQARELLHTCVHKGENGTEGGPMWNPANKLIDFVVGCGYSDPSYHLPHFYELFAEYANEEDREFWKEAAKASREYLKKACHPVTGLNAEYAEYDGSPKRMPEEKWKMFGHRHDWFYSDAYRTIANIALDYEWYGKDEELRGVADRLQKFFAETVKDCPDMTYEIDGTVLDRPALHPIGLLATNAQASLAAKGPYAKEFVMKFWNTPLRTGDRRYYDNCLYLFAMLALSGNYRAW
ncbi:MAG: xylanase [Lachnospiraceae bacterium]|nr:xylanase [Lachnospiraceae bacterium]